MAKLFDKITGTTTSYDSDGITDSSAAWTVDYYKDWYVTINNIEYLITSNTATTLSFSNSLTADKTYEISFVTRKYLEQLESDIANTTKIPNNLIDKKYNQANFDISNKIFAYLRGLYKNDFDPLANIANLTMMQQSFGYYLLAKIYQDLMIDQESFEGFKGYNMYEKSYIDGVKDSLALLQIDLNGDGNISADEKSQSVSTYSFLSR